MFEIQFCRFKRCIIHFGFEAEVKRGVSRHHELIEGHADYAAVMGGYDGGTLVGNGIRYRPEYVALLHPFTQLDRTEEDATLVGSYPL